MKKILFSLIVALNCISFAKSASPADTEVEKTQAHVSAKFVVKDDSFQLDYYLGKKGRQWLIQDIAYEELKYSSNIREQLDAFLKEKSFSELLGKLRKRREDLDKPPKTKAS
ncbi:MAG: hypothetical protein EB078_04045 [Proteobacteria bacterium]|nr:hypothetical protein [Pseudomonadota bacterium]